MKQNKTHHQSIELDLDQIEKKTVLVTLFFGLPGLGKTTFFEELKKIQKETDINMKYLSEDDMWKSLMEEQKILTPELTETECFWKIFAKGNYLFWQNLKKKMNQISESEGKNTVLFLDKIIYPDTLEPILKRLRTEQPENCDIKFIAVLPKQSSGFESKGRKWIFSLSLLFDCITRVINRKHHSTLCGNPSRSTSVLIEIYNKFRNFQVTKGFLQKHGIYKKIEIPFIKEVYQFEKNMDSNMMKELINIFDNHEPGQMVAQEKVQNMLDGVKRIGQVFKFPNKDEIFSIARLELFKLFPQVLDFTKRRNSY